MKKKCQNEKRLDSFLRAFTWKGYPGIAQPSTYGEFWGTCVIESVLSCIADQFLIAKLITRPVQLSAQYLLANYPSDQNQDDIYLLQVSRDKYICHSGLSDCGFLPLNLLQFIQCRGITTTRCLGALPDEIFFAHQYREEILQNISTELDSEITTVPHDIDVNILKRSTQKVMNKYILQLPKRTCFVSHDKLYMFYVKDVHQISLCDSKSCHFKDLQDTIKAHIKQYGPVISNILVSKELERIFNSDDESEAKLTSNANPDSVFLDSVDFKKEALIDIDSLTSKDLLVEDMPNHSIAVVGWGITRVARTLVSPMLQTTSKEWVDVPYWECRNNWGADKVCEGWMRIAMFPYNKTSNYRGK